MTDNARNLINSPYSLNFAYAVGKYTPDKIGRRIATFIADFLSAHKGWNMVRATRCNQWVVNGEKIDQGTLDKLVAKNYRYIATSIFDFYHNMNNPAAFLKAIEVHPLALRFVQRPEFSDRGLLLAGIHMSNFEMMIELIGLAGVKALAITLPEFNPAYQKQWEMRRKSGIKFINASVGSIKYAINYLRQGGLVVTAIDRPDQASPYRPKFFGYPSAMPIHHIFMATKAHVPIMIASILKRSDGKYHFLFSDPIEMQSHEERHTEIVLNAENVLSVVEGFIGQDPSQWSMTFPVWPDLMARF